MERSRRRIVYPPIHEEIDRWGDLVHRVALSTGTATIIVDRPGAPLSREEAQEMVRELLLQGLMEGRYPESDFYPQDLDDMDVQLPHAAVDGHGLEEEAYASGCLGSIPASGEAVMGLPETSVKEGECSICLLDFETSSKLRMMPCSHYFHEQCIFTWLQLNHVCPLCRFPLPTEQQ